MERRTQTADVLKGIAVLLMVQVHVVELFATETIYNSPIGKISLFLGGAPVAPIFMIVFGYFIFSSQKTAVNLIWRGLGIFALGMILNLALNFNLIFSSFQGKLEVDIWPYLFGVDILHFAGLSLIIIALFKNIFQKYIGLTISIILLLPFLGKLSLYYIPENNSLLFISAYFYGSTDWSYFPILPWLAYPLTGIALNQLQQRVNHTFLNLPKTKIIIGNLCLLLLVLTIRYAGAVSSNLLVYYHHGVLFFLWVIVYCLLYSLVIYEITQWLGETIVSKYIKWLGRNVTLLYITQWVIIGNAATEIYKTVSSPIYLVCWFIGIVIVSSGISYLVLNLKKKWSKH